MAKPSHSKIFRRMASIGEESAAFVGENTSMKRTGKTPKSGEHKREGRMQGIRKRSDDKDASPIAAQTGERGVTGIFANATA